MTTETVRLNPYGQPVYAKPGQTKKIFVSDSSDSSTGSCLSADANLHWTARIIS